MKKTILALPILMALSCQPEGQKKVLFFGDSITFMGDDPGGYLVKMRETIAAEGRAGAFMVNGSGIGGNKIYDLYLRAERDVIEKGPDIAVVFVGVNDVWHKRTLGTGTDVEKFGPFYSALIKKLRAAGIAVILATPVCIGEKTGLANEMDAELELFSKMIRDLATNHNCPLVDLRKLFLKYNSANNPQNLPSGILTTDGVHLNDAGNALVARAFLDVLK